MPIHMNPAEFLLELMNIDFATHQEAAAQRLHEMQIAWASSPKALELNAHIETTISKVEGVESARLSSRNFFPILMTLTHRSFVKSYRDVVAYGIRIAMYGGLAIMMGTVWLRLAADQKNINSFTNAIVCIIL